MSTHKTFRTADRLTHTERVAEGTQERELDTAAMATVRVSQMLRGRKGGREPLRVVIPNGTETDIQPSLGKSYLSLKIKASDSKQL